MECLRRLLRKLGRLVNGAVRQEKQVVIRSVCQEDIYADLDGLGDWKSAMRPGHENLPSLTHVIRSPRCSVETKLYTHTQVYSTHR